MDTSNPDIDDTSELAADQPTDQPGERPATALLLKLGLGIVVAGFAVVLFAWGEVAGLDNLALQLPYLISGGMFGLGLVFLGLAVVVVSIVQQAASARDRELQELQRILRQMADLLAQELPRSGRAGS